jgi:hypothetical protein
VVTVGNALASDFVKKVVVIAHICGAVFVDTGAVSLATTVEGTTDRTTREEVVIGVAVTRKWISGALGDGPLER